MKATNHPNTRPNHCPREIGVLLGRMAFAMQPHPAEGKPSGSQRQVFGAALLTPWSKSHENQ